MYVPGVSAGGSIVLMLIRVGDILSLLLLIPVAQSVPCPAPGPRSSKEDRVHLPPCCSETFPLGATGRMPLFGFRSRTFKMDFYSPKNTADSHAWSLPLLGPVQLPRNKSAQALGPVRETWCQADLWTVPEKPSWLS